MMFFAYTQFLERENNHLKSRIEALELRNQELVLTLTSKISIPQAPKPKQKHEMKKTETSASCSCGWNAVRNDPAELQQEIEAHYHQSTAPLTRRSWPQIKAMAEESNAD